jgi:hypothetical protein
VHDRGFHSPFPVCPCLSESVHILFLFLYIHALLSEGKGWLARIYEQRLGVVASAKVKIIRETQRKQRASVGNNAR